jgi:hypothetical protein
MRHVSRLAGVRLNVTQTPVAGILLCLDTACKLPTTSSHTLRPFGSPAPQPISWSRVSSS